MSIYNAIVRPYFDYCSEVWDVFGEVQCKQLQKLQNRAARVISNMSNNEDYSITLRALGWEPLHIMRKKAKARMMYKTLNKLGPEHRIGIITEVPLLSEPLMSMGPRHPRTSPRASWPPFC